MLMVDTNIIISYVHKGSQSKQIQCNIESTGISCRLCCMHMIWDEQLQSNI